MVAHNHEGLQVAENSKNYHYATYTFIRWGRRRESVVENLWLTKSHKHAVCPGGEEADLKSVGRRACRFESCVLRQYGSRGGNGRFVLPYKYKIAEAWSFIDSANDIDSNKDLEVVKPKQSNFMDLLFKILNIIRTFFSKFEKKIK